jgi:hypothetical protein
MNPIYKTHEVETLISKEWTTDDLIKLAQDLENRLNQATETVEYFRCSGNHDALDAYEQIRRELGMGPFEGDALERVAKLVRNQT